MKSVIGMVSGGAAAVLKAMPMGVKAPLLLGVGLLGGAELVVEGNHALNSGAIFGGQGTTAVADGRTKTAEADAATQTLRELSDRLARAEATSAEALRLFEVQTKKFEAALREEESRAKRAEADSMVKTEAELIRGEKLRTNTSTESQRLSEVRRMRAEAVIKEGEAYAAEANGVASKQASEIASKVFTDMQRGGGQTPRALGNMSRSILNGKF